MEVTKILIQSGVDINSQNKQGFTPLHLATMKGHMAAINILIQAGVEVNFQNRNGSTALHLASRKHQVEIIWALFAAGADKKIKDKNGDTPYDSAKWGVVLCNECFVLEGRACENAIHALYSFPENAEWLTDDEDTDLHTELIID